MDLNKLFEILEINTTDAIIDLTQKDWKSKVSFPSRVKRLLENTHKWNPKALFCFNNNPLILFFEANEIVPDLHKIIWNFNETPIIIISEPHTVSIYNGFSISNEGLLRKLGGNEKLDDFKYFELVTGKTFEKYKEEFNYKNRVDYKLLNNIEETQRELTQRFNCNRKIANALLGKIIFIRYLIDRKVKLTYDGASREWTNDEFCCLLQNKSNVFNFFEYLSDKEKGFNGDLFPINKDEFDNIPDDAFNLIRRLLEGETIKTGQKSLFNLYDFSILPIEFISNVYEKFIGRESQAIEGAYYTPTFLVDYIISQTVSRKLSTHTYSCKVLDPACGSGIFLVEALRKIIEKNFDTNISDKKDDFKKKLRDLATNNIFGVDKDESAIQVAIFSIYLTLLDYQQPPEIETFQFPNLLNTNFFVGDFFDDKAQFVKVLETQKLDFILGNPPWAGGKNGLNSIGRKYLKQRELSERKQSKQFNIGINNNEIAEGFLLRASDFSSMFTQIAFVIRSSILYNRGYNDVSPFRQYWLQEFFIEKVFELAPVRYEVFNRSNDPSIAPAAIVFYRYAEGKNTDKNIVEHITLKPSHFFSTFKIFTIQRHDYKRVEQNRLKCYDWLWKTLVYGNYLDFNLLCRIKKEIPTIKVIVEDKTKFTEGTGIQYSNTGDSNSEHLIGLPFIDSYGIDKFYINKDKISSFNKARVHRIRNDKASIFKAPMLLIRKGLDLETLSIRSAISNQDLLFKDSLTSISVIDPNHINYLYNIQAVFSTDILSYYAVNSFAFIGIEREQAQNYDKYSLPYLELDVQNEIDEIVKIKEEISINKDNLFNSSKEELNNKINTILKKLNDKIFQKLTLSDSDKALIDYSICINKRMILNKESEKDQLFASAKPDDSLLLDYAQLYINRFSPSLSRNGKKFVVEIWHSNKIIGMFFKIIDESNYLENIHICIKQDENELINAIIKLGTKKLTEKLFIQKDIRGFESDYFYIFKPNEKRLWHKAIGYLDIAEFSDAILKSGRDFDD